MGKLYGAVFKDHPEWKNDGVIRVENEDLFASLLLTSDIVGRLNKKNPLKSSNKTVTKEQIRAQEMVSTFRNCPNFRIG